MLQIQYLDKTKFAGTNNIENIVKNLLIKYSHSVWKFK